MALKVRGQLHASRGDEDAASKDFDAAIEIFEKLESRLELERADTHPPGTRDACPAKSYANRVTLVGQASRLPGGGETHPQKNRVVRSNQTPGNANP
jgi:hypothetical protein